MATRTRRGAKKSDGRMSLGQHLVELRNRLLISAAAIVVFAVAGFLVSDFVIDQIQEPLTAIAEATGSTANLNFGGVGTAFDVRLQIAIVIGIIASSPVWLYQLFAFLVPGLTSKERRYTFAFFFSAVPLFLGGCATGWIVFPHIVQVLNSFVPEGTVNLVEAKEYLGFVLKLVLAIGIAFVLPVFLVLLNFVGVLSGVSIIKSWRWAIIGIFVFCALATPSADVGSMFLLAAPIIVLYLASAGVALLHDRAVRKRAERLSAELDAELGDAAAA
jgi:sec-independent protein translocase protein TatC